MRLDQSQCPTCGYDLEGLALLGDRVTCPECGTTHTREDLTARHERSLRRAVVRVCLPAAASPIAVVVLVLMDREWSRYAAMVVPVLAVMASVLLLGVHAAAVRVPPRSLHVVRLALIGVLAHWLSLVACMLGIGAAFWGGCFAT